MGLNVASGDVLIEKELPIFTAWQSMPVSFIALAWCDNEFKHQFLHTPTNFLHRVMEGCPSDVVFCALENTKELRHLVLPYRHPDTFDWSRAQVEAQLRKELLYHSNLCYGLPIHIIAEAYFDPHFKRRLIVSPVVVLNEKGYDVGNYNYFVHENTAQTSHLVLPENIWDSLDLSYDQLEGRLLDELEQKVVH